MERADTVFAGKVIDIDYQEGLFATKRSFPYILFPWDLRRTEATVIVSKVWKGEVYSETIVITGLACGYHFEQGEEYLIYGSGSLSDIGTGMCSRTRPLSGAAEDLMALGDGRPPRRTPLFNRLSLIRPLGFAIPASFFFAGMFFIGRRLRRAG